MGSPATGLAAGLAAIWAAGLAARLEVLARGLAALRAGLAAGLAGGSSPQGGGGGGSSGLDANYPPPQLTIVQRPPRGEGVGGSWRPRTRGVAPPALWKAICLRNILGLIQFPVGKNICPTPYTTSTLCPHNLSVGCTVTVLFNTTGETTINRC